MVKQVFMVVCLACLLVPSLVARKGWYRYKTPRYNFQMMVPFETTFVNKIWAGGWAGVIGAFGDVKVYAMTKQGQIVSRKVLENLGLSISDIAKDEWRVIDDGAGNGWKWRCTVKASNENTVAFGGYGTDEHSSYLIIMTTPISDFASHREAYDFWYENVKLLNKVVKKSKTKKRPVAAHQKVKKRAPKTLPIASKKGAGKGRAWRKYEDSENGFSMLLPAGTKVLEDNLPNGWGGLVASKGPVKFFGIARKQKIRRREIEELVSRLTGLKCQEWKTLAEGRGEGWGWYRTVEAQRGNVVLFGGYGQSAKASFIFVLRTIKIDYRFFRNDYRKWYESVKLND